MSSTEKLSGGCLDCSSQALDESIILRNMGLMGTRINLYLFKKLVDEIPWEAALRDRGAHQRFQDTVLSSSSM